ncbi:phage integrase SAM-like domain-containing protein [Runella sp. SP2]|uniref:phage integrase SAM-like domain-containing protein n=1 Tax=Runella sp. SP2 TaxID=2268026 RepID=UPI000F07A882|nr:phage integrase SAM-like domain-containing protein [Runella sp. SP2]AYQ31405.1 hypothetical protein DTQ70_04070 [Runella sp. SP2]
MEILFFRHQSKKERKTHTCTIYHRITINGVRAELYSTSISGRWDDFDKERQRFKSTDKDYVSKNARIGQIESDLMELYALLVLRKKPFTPAHLKEMYKVGIQEYTLPDLYNKWIKELRDEGRPKKQTVDRYEDIGDTVVKFLIAKKKLTENAESFDVDMLKQYQKYLLREDFAEATIRKHQSVVKQMLNWAKVEKYITQNPLEGYKIKHEKVKPHIYLDVEQFELLRRHKFSTEKLQKVADVFSIYCRTGFHYKDLKQMAAVGKSTIRTVAGVDFINWNRVKTNELAKVPSSAWPDVAEIIAKYGDWNKLPIISNQKMNDYLKLMATELNLVIQAMTIDERQRLNLRPIHPELSVKAGRKTLADWLLNELSWSREAVKVVLGLKSDRSLDSYVREDERRVIHEIRRQKIA